MANVPEQITKYFGDETKGEGDFLIVQACRNGTWYLEEAPATWPNIHRLLDEGVSAIGVSCVGYGDCVVDFTATALKAEANRPALPSAPRRA